MTPAADRTYRIAAFAALAGVTVRALHHYDRLGLLRPRRSSAGYRLYSERDLERLEEIVALKFIGVPLKKIAAILRRAQGPLVDVLHAQRDALEARRSAITRAITAVAAAETSLRSGSPIDATLFRHIMEVMHMETNHEAIIETYSARLRAQASHVSALSAAQRAALQQQWSALVADMKASLDEDPGGPKAQHLLDRWIAFLDALRGNKASTLVAHAADATPEMRNALWARRAEWLPADAERRAPATAEAARTQVLEQLTSVADADVLAFIARARAARR